MLKLLKQEHSLLTENILKTFTQNRIVTLLDFLEEDVDKLSTLSKLSLPQVLEIRNHILAKYSAPLLNGTSLYVNRLTCKQFIRTGIDSLDEILSNGIPVGFITEICGLAGCGKSQLCMQLAINCVNNTSSVLYIDTKGDFSAVRIQKNLESCGFSHKEMAITMLQIKIIHIWTMDDLLKLFAELKNGILFIENLSLIIIDSLPSLMFQHFGDDNKIGLKFLNNFVNYARHLSKTLQIGIVCVNIQTRWIDQDLVELEDDNQATSTRETIYTEKLNRCMGKYWQNIPNIVLLLEKYQNSNENVFTINVSLIKYNNPHISKRCQLEVGMFGIK
ncbi:DNA repair protein RAD51 homolog 4 [Bicyclus anynana]|uniref:DNA repair protein RAD51 homolog 4 n=1 Tax=Bicyclus anynana TaxID=110368 RepID=A0ABM3LF13_BICAN|nr:DNA repair protein RAD51 homolog 4 [Bicyclus anynana]